MISVALPRRMNFLEDTENSNPVSQASCRVSKQEEQEIDSKWDRDSTAGAILDQLHLDNVCWSMILPSIFHHLTHEAISYRLYEVLFRPLGLDASPRIREAVTAPSASISPDCQRLEFIGDSVLKFAMTSDLYLRYPHWHEGYLTVDRSRSVQCTTRSSCHRQGSQSVHNYRALQGAPLEAHMSAKGRRLCLSVEETAFSEDLGRRGKGDSGSSTHSFRHERHFYHVRMR